MAPGARVTSHGLGKHFVQVAINLQSFLQKMLDSLVANDRPNWRVKTPPGSDEQIQTRLKVYVLVTEKDRSAESDDESDASTHSDTPQNAFDPIEWEKSIAEDQHTSETFILVTELPIDVNGKEVAAQEIAVFGMFTEQHEPKPDWWAKNSSRSYKFGSPDESPEAGFAYLQLLEKSDLESKPSRHSPTVSESVIIAYAQYWQLITRGAGGLHLWRDPPQSIKPYFFFRRGEKKETTALQHQAARSQLRKWYLEIFARAGLDTKPFVLGRPQFPGLPRFGPYHSNDMRQKTQVFKTPGHIAVTSSFSELLQAAIAAVETSDAMVRLRKLLQDQSLVCDFSDDREQLTFVIWASKPIRVFFLSNEEPGERVISSHPDG